MEDPSERNALLPENLIGIAVAALNKKRAAHFAIDNPPGFLTGIHHS